MRTDDFPPLAQHLPFLHVRIEAILCMVCAFQYPQPLLLTHFMNLGGVPERLTQFMFISKFIQKGNLCCPLSSLSQVWEE
jgi:hypothetical protein